MPRKKRARNASQQPTTPRPAAQGGQGRVARQAWTSFALVCLAFAIVAFGLIVGWEPTLVSEGSSRIADIPKQGLTFPAIPLKATQRVHNLLLHGTLSGTMVTVAETTFSGFWATVEATLETSEGRVALETLGDFWDGSDAEGYDASLRAKTSFVLKQAGTYVVRLTVEASEGNTGSIGYTLYSGALDPTYLAGFGIGMFCLTIFAFTRAES